jgi:hypothetical protein
METKLRSCRDPDVSNNVAGQRATGFLLHMYHQNAIDLDVSAECCAPTPVHIFLEIAPIASAGLVVDASRIADVIDARV